MKDLTREDVLHIAKLSKLQLTEDEIALFQKDLSSILSYMTKLQELDLPHDAPQMVYAVDTANVFVADADHLASEQTRKRITDNFPKQVGDLLETPAALDRT